MWFLVPVNPIGPDHAAIVGKGEWALGGLFIAALTLFLSKLASRKTIR
jgi:hypothetical protein